MILLGFMYGLKPVPTLRTFSIEFLVRPGIYPRRKRNLIIVGFSPWGMLSCPIRVSPRVVSIRYGLTEVRALKQSRIFQQPVQC